MTTSHEERKRLFIALWPFVAFLSLVVPLPLFTPIACVAMFGFASRLVIKQRSLGFGTKFGLIALWVVGILCFVYAVIAFGAMVESADLMRADPLWAQAFLPALAVGFIAFFVSPLLIWKMTSLGKPVLR